MSAIHEEPDEISNGKPAEPIKVLITTHEGMNLMDLAGPLEVFAQTKHEKSKPDSKAFRVLFAGADKQVNTDEGATLSAHMSYDEAMKRLSEIDVLVVPGGGSQNVLKGKSQPIPLIRAFAELQKKNPSRERSLLSVCTGSLFLAEAGILAGLSATTHPDYITKMEILCSNIAQRDMTDRTDVMEARYVVNNLRFELGENEGEENPYIMTRKELKEQKRRKSSVVNGPPSPVMETNGYHDVGAPPAANGRRASMARKGSMSLQMSNTRRESVLKRANLRLGGLRVLTTGGVTSGIDGALYMVGALVSDEAAEETARYMCYDWKKGVVVDGTDV